MAACSHIPTCELFPMISVNSALKVWRTFYCEGKYHECSRYKLSLEGKSVPANLLPNGRSLDLAVGIPKTTPAAASTPATPVSTPVEKAGVIDIDISTDTAPAPAPAVSAATSTGDTMSYYLRMQITSGVGVMSEIIRTLGSNHVRIEAVSEKKALTASAPSYLIVLIDQATDAVLGGAITALQNLGCVQGEIKKIALEKMTNGHLV